MAVMTLRYILKVPVAGKKMSLSSPAVVEVLSLGIFISRFQNEPFLLILIWVARKFPPGMPCATVMAVFQPVIPVLPLQSWTPSGARSEKLIVPAYAALNGLMWMRQSWSAIPSVEKVRTTMSFSPGL